MELIVAVIKNTSLAYRSKNGTSSIHQLLFNFGVVEFSISKGILRPPGKQGAGLAQDNIIQNTTCLI
jgi:hypothetical protein